MMLIHGADVVHSADVHGADVVRGADIVRGAEVHGADVVYGTNDPVYVADVVHSINCIYDAVCVN